MFRRPDTHRVLLLLVALGFASGCTRDTSRMVEVGHHRVRLLPPEGWEPLDRGRQQSFRNGEMAVSLVDLGPATSEGLVREIREAEQLWRAGRWPDAYARVRQLRGAPLGRANSGERLEFWKEWQNATYVPERADSQAIGAAFAALIEGAEALPELTHASLLEYTVGNTIDLRRMEIAREVRREVHGAEWTDVETWDRVSHLARSRLAYVEHDGYLLVLSIERGPIEQADPAFEALLASIELEPGPRLVH